jgi:hypothetical protein
MLPLSDATIDDILECMRTHRTMCGYAFHDQCREWMVLSQLLDEKSGKPAKVYDHSAIVNQRMYVLELEHETT